MLWAVLGRRELQAGNVERALGYPWERPGASYILRSGDVQLLDDAEPATIEAFIADRHPLLAYGGNGAPSWLTAKFAHFHRLGSFCIDDAPVALGAIPASGRTAAALTQEEVLDAAARMVIGPDA